jgi:hypothetical protein
VNLTGSNAFRERARYEAERYGSDSWVFVRELLQNARDAGAKSVQFETARIAGRERITCRDDGEGMTFAHAQRYLFTLYASSKKGRSKTAGRFGIGFWSILRFSPQTIVVRSRPSDGEGWQVRLDGELVRVVREDAKTMMIGTEVGLERPDSETDLEERVRRAVLRDAPFLSRRGRGDGPLEVLVDGRPVRAEPELPPPSLSFHRRGLRGAVGLGAEPRVEVFAHGLRVRDASSLDELLLGEGQKDTPLPSATHGLAPRVIIDSRDLLVLMARGDAREDRALRRLVAIGDRELGRLVRAELDRFARPGLQTRIMERMRDLWSARRVRWAVGVCAAIALTVGVWWLGMSPLSSNRGTSISRVFPPEASEPEPSLSVPYQGFDRTYRGPSVRTLDRAAPAFDLYYRPASERPFIAALLITELGEDGSVGASDATGIRPYAGRSCTEGCLEILVGIDTDRHLLPLPVPSGHLVDVDSVRLEGVPLPVVELASGQPAVRFDTPRAGRVTYRTGPGPSSETKAEAGWPELPEEALDLAREIEVLPRAHRAMVVADWVARHVVYDTSPTIAARYCEEATKGLGVFHRSLSIGAGDCDVQNSLVAAILDSTGVPARLAVGWVGANGRVPSGLHAWAEFLGEHGVWKVVDASTLRDPEGRHIVAPPVSRLRDLVSMETWGWMPIILVGILLVAGSAALLSRRSWKRCFHVDSATDIPGLLRGAATRPGAFARIRPLFTRRVVPLLDRPPISLARARKESLRGSLCVGSRSTRLAARASAGGGAVIDAELPEGRSVADALGAVDLDRWQQIFESSWSDEVTSRVEGALRAAGQPCRLRVGNGVGQEAMVLDGGLLGIETNECLAVVSAKGDLWREVSLLARQREPARAALWLADSMVHRIGVPRQERGRCLARLAEAAIEECSCRKS